MDIRLTINGSERRFARPVTVGALVGEMGMQGRRIAIERNGEIVPRGLYDATTLADGDRLEVVVAVGGG
jgi:sulfur carrier protein